MKLAIMQPYFFPYLGYFQLLNAVDKFVVYDDVAFIKQGWINRNNILLNGKKHLFTIPVKSISSFANINETHISNAPFNWSEKLLNTFALAYKNAPFFKDVFPLLDETVGKAAGKLISEVARSSILLVHNYLGLRTEVVESSSCYLNNELKAEHRVMDICKKENAGVYINVIGGTELYSKERFEEKGIKLFFVKSSLSPYQQFKHDFMPGLSMIDVLMFNSKERVHNLLTEYQLV